MQQALEDYRAIGGGGGGGGDNRDQSDAVPAALIASDNNNDESPAASMSAVPRAAPAPESNARRRRAATFDPPVYQRSRQTVEQTDIGEYSFLRSRENLLGRGSFADVFRGTNRQTGAGVAVKVVDVARVSRGNLKLLDHLEDEMKISMELRHPNIVQLFAVHHLDVDTLCMVFELCDSGDLGAYMKLNGRLSENHTRAFMRQLAAGISYVHERNIVHRDIKVCFSFSISVFLS
jgi:Protein kinase domain